MIIIGIDFGHGETTASYVDTTMQDKQPKPLIIRKSTQEKEKKIPSVIFFEKGRYSILNTNGKLISGFKCRILSNAEETKLRVGNYEEFQRYKEKKEAFAAFAKCVVEQIESQNNNLKTPDGTLRDDIKYYIAAPTSWTASQKLIYRDFIQQATGREIGWVMNESDAAFFTKRSEGSVLIIDYGSSTIDFTMMNDGRKVISLEDNGKTIDFDTLSSKDLGASRVEDSMMIDYKATNKDAYRKVNDNTNRKLSEENLSYIDSDAYLRNQFREDKETAYTKHGGRQTFDSSINVMLRVTNKKQYISPDYKYQYNNIQIDSVIGDYKNDVRKKFQEINRALLSNKVSLEKIILSGGASIMPWVGNLVFDVFGKSPEEDDLPAYIVSHGIVNYAMAQNEALELLIAKLEKVNLKDIYGESDARAIEEAVKALIPAVTREIIDSENCTGNDMLAKYCDFIQHLDKNNYTYVEIFERKFNQELTFLISKAIAESVKEIFHVEIDSSDVSIDIHPEIIPFPEKQFCPGGVWFEYFSRLISKHSGKLIFTWELRREKAIRKQIANGVEKSLVTYLSYSGMKYNDGILSEVLFSLKTQMMFLAKELFYKKQIFDTTFKQ